MHHPVLLKQAIDGLDIKKTGSYIDATVGEGGHIKEIAKRAGCVLGIDWDDNQIKNLKLKIKNFENVILEVGNFAQIEEIAKKHHFFQADGILFDLGLSVSQIKNSGRGFSYENFADPLDMRINKSTHVTASEFINSLSEAELYEILAGYGEEIHSRSIVHALVRTRSLKPVITVRDLVSIIDKSLGKRNTKTNARVFQALRIIVNKEIENLKQGLESSLNIIKPGGRIVVLTFHSIEDRVVKTFVKSHRLRMVKKMVGSRTSSVRYERSAVLRILSKL